MVLFPFIMVDNPQLTMMPRFYDCEDLHSPIVHRALINMQPLQQRHDISTLESAQHRRLSRRAYANVKYTHMPRASEEVKYIILRVLYDIEAKIQMSNMLQEVGNLA